jgi:hypothetical protein
VDLPRLVAAERTIAPDRGEGAAPEGTVLVPVDPGDPRSAYRLWVAEPTAA